MPTAQLRHRLITRLIGFYLAPMALVVVVFAVYQSWLQREGYERELARRLEALAHMTAVAVAPNLAWVPAGDRESVNYRNLLGRLKDIREANGVERLLIFHPDLTSRLDTDPAIRPNDRVFSVEQDRVEIESALVQGKAVASPLFPGRDGRYYKTGYAPIVEEGRVVALVGVVASADFFESLRRSQANLVRFGLASVAAIVAVSWVLSRRLLRPIRQLVQDAERIGQGRLDSPVRVEGRDEIGLLAETMERMRRGIAERDRNMQMMLQGIAHEIRNPLGGIELFAGLLRKQLAADDPRLSRYVEKIQAENNNLKRLVEDFLAYSRETCLQPEPFPLGRLASDLHDAFRTELESKGIRWRFEGDPEQEVVMDYQQIRRVFLNLIRNAIQAMGEPGEIRLGAERANGRLHVELDDTGKGLGGEPLTRAFEAFYTTKEQGSGLGLAFSRKIVEGHQGRIAIANRPQGGARVSIDLPQPPPTLH